MTQPTLTLTRDGRAELRFPYDALFIERLKATVPAYARAYDPIGKTWTVRPPYTDVAARLMFTVFPDVDVVEQTSAGTTFDRGGDPREAALIVLHLRETAPPELIGAAHKCLARLHHPDQGGSHETMLAVNAAAEALRRTR